MQTFYWLIIFVIALIVEIATMGLTSIWFAGGALIAWVFAKIGFGTTVQIVVFVIASLLLLVLTRPIAVKFFNVQRQGKEERGRKIYSCILEGDYRK